MTRYQRSNRSSGQEAESAALANEPGLEFEAFFDREKTRLFQALCVVTRNRFEAEELTQEAFIAVFGRYWSRCCEPANGDARRTLAIRFTGDGWALDSLGSVWLGAPV